MCVSPKTERHMYKARVLATAWHIVGIQKHLLTEWLYEAVKLMLPNKSHYYEGQRFDTFMYSFSKWVFVECLLCARQWLIPWPYKCFHQVPLKLFTRENPQVWWQKNSMLYLPRNCITIYIPIRIKKLIINYFINSFNNNGHLILSSWSSSLALAPLNLLNPEQKLSHLQLFKFCYF